MKVLGDVLPDIKKVFMELLEEIKLLNENQQETNRLLRKIETNTNMGSQYPTVDLDDHTV